MPRPAFDHAVPGDHGEVRGMRRGEPEVQRPGSLPAAWAEERCGLRADEQQSRGAGGQPDGSMERRTSGAVHIHIVIIHL
jgi:hypothetical protein